MDIEFHYYITHLIAARAGVRNEALRIIPHACQLTDDNDTVYAVRDGRRGIYRNRISQTLRPLNSHRERLAVYPLFHFIPGDPHAPGAARADGRTHPFNTTPNSPNANRILDAALATGDPYRIGIACHAYADTWAHQNFVGFKCDFNRFDDFVARLIPNIGHADAQTRPDQPRLVWRDARLLSPVVDNKQRFLDAASALFAKLRAWAAPQRPDSESERRALRSDLDAAIGTDPGEETADAARLAGYRRLAEQPAYGATPIPEYAPDAWFCSAVRVIRQRGGNPGPGRRMRKGYAFKTGYELSDWFRFQNAVASYAERARALLCETPELAAEYRRAGLSPLS